MFGEHIARWGLVPDGEPIVTRAARLLPVRRDGLPAMLKVAVEAEERFGGLLMGWWNGDGAAALLASHGDAILLERAMGRRSLSAFARTGRDDEATRILCATIARLHAPRPAPPPDLIPLQRWFQALEPAAAVHGGPLARSAEAARALLADPREVAVLHGDVHHDNIIDFEERGWLAIDPKRLVGERAFDYANLFCNPDLAGPDRPVATGPGRFERRLAIVCDAAGLERRRLLRWILAWTGLSAAWFLADGAAPETNLRIAALALAELDR